MVAVSGALCRWCSVFLSVALLALPAATLAQDEAPFSSPWISVRGMSEADAVEMLTEELSGLEGIVINAQADSLREAFEESMNVFNARWENKRFDLEAAMDLAMADVHIHDNERVRVSEEMAYNEALMASYQELLAYVKGALSGAEGRLRNAERTRDFTFESRSEYYVVYLKAIVPAELSRSMTSTQIAEMLYPVASSEGVRYAGEHVRTRSWYEGDDFVEYVLSASSGVVSSLAPFKPRFVAETPDRTGAILVALYPLSISLRKQENVPAGVSGDRAMVPGGFQVTVGPKVVFDASNPESASGIDDELAVQAWPRVVDHFENMSLRIQAFQREGAAEAWTVRYEEARDRVLEAEHSVARTESHADSLLRLVDRTEATLAAAKQRESRVKSDLQQATTRLGEILTRRKEHLRSRSVIYFPNLDDIEDTVDIERLSLDAALEERLVDLYGGLVHHGRIDVLHQVERYAHVEDVEAVIKDEVRLAAYAAVDSAMIVFAGSHPVDGKIWLAPAVMLRTSIDTDQLIEFNPIPLDDIMAEATVDEEGAWGKYRGLVYAVLDVPDWGVTHDEALVLVGTVNSEGFLNCRNWRLPSIEELDALRFVARGEEQTHNYTVFPKLPIRSVERGGSVLYWTSELAEQWGFDDTYYAVAFGKTKHVTPIPETAAGYVIVVADACE